MAVRVELARGVAPDRGVEGGVDVAEHDGAAGGEPLRPQACIVRHTAFLGQQEHRFVDGRREPQRLENDEPQLVIVAKREIEAGRRALRGGALFSRREGPDVEASKEAHHQRVGEGLWTEQPCDDRGGHELVDELGLAHAPGRVAVVVGPAQLARVFRDRLERLVVGERRRRGKDLSQRRDLLLNLRRVHFADDLARRDNHMPRRRWVVVLRPHRRAVDLVARVVPNVDADHSPKDQTRAKQIDEPEPAPILPRLERALCVGKVVLHFGGRPLDHRVRGLHPLGRLVVPEIPSKRGVERGVRAAVHWTGSRRQREREALFAV
mmetsp:Transcript_17582/g.55997  ORF Transcript_17582/g.55997 Transcript_17582/m.55997 type:complete len:322 (+) Transcript_17582:280-1245(+)